MENKFYCVTLSKDIDLNEHKDIARTPEPLDNFKTACDVIKLMSTRLEKTFAVVERDLEFHAILNVLVVAFNGELYFPGGLPK